jgi:hypothetical protein
MRDSVLFNPAWAQWAVWFVLSDAVTCDWRILEGRAISFCFVYGFGLIETQNYMISCDFLGQSPPSCGKILYINNKKEPTPHLLPPRLFRFFFFFFLPVVPSKLLQQYTHCSMDSFGLRKIRLVEGNGKCGHLKKLISKGTLRLGFICQRPPPLLGFVWVGLAIF